MLRTFFLSNAEGTRTTQTGGLQCFNRDTPRVEVSKTNGMADYDLGDIKRVDDLRSVWKHEASDFTRWLAEEENLNLLSEGVGMRYKTC